MILLLTLALIGAAAGGLGGALTNGLDGFVLGGCAGFVLGVVVWVTEHKRVSQMQQLQPDQLLNEFYCPSPPAYEQPAPACEQPSERSRSS